MRRLLCALLGVGLLLGAVLPESLLLYRNRNLRSLLRGEHHRTGGSGAGTGAADPEQPEALHHRGEHRYASKQSLYL